MKRALVFAGLLCGWALHADAVGAAREDAGDAGERTEVVITASRIRGDAAPGRRLTIIEAEEIESAPVRSVAELLEYAAGVDIRRRGPEGIQADMSIRGSTFEQVLVLVDGVKMSDPQTGHHTMDIPVVLSDIDRVEVLHGQGSSVHGPNAFGGVVHIITKKPGGCSGRVEGSAGENSFSSGTLSVSAPVGGASHRVSLQRTESGPYQHNTEFDISTVSYQSGIETRLLPVRVSIGHMDKKFGAGSFFSESFPDQWEATETTTAQVRGETAGDELVASGVVYWRRHRDTFILDRTSAQFPVNTHTTHLYGSELSFSLERPWGAIAFGAEIAEESIDSSNLGDRSRGRGALFFEYQSVRADAFLLDVGMRGDHYEGWVWEGSPGASLAYRVGHSLMQRGSAGRSFRVPTYTELYYETAANKGDPDLVPEEAWSYELGLDHDDGVFSWGATMFRREGEDLIDWVREEGDAPWEASNISEVDSQGLELTFSTRPDHAGGSCPVSCLSLGYTYLDQDSRRGEGLESKYVMDYLRHQAVAVLRHDAPLRLGLTWRLSYSDRVGGDSYFLLDARLARKLGDGGAELFLLGTNLLGTSYEEIGGVLMPGRWLSAGVSVEF